MFERLVALHVTDEEGYARYRSAMTPILEGYGGSFRYDFRVGETLKSDGSHPVNRVFLLSFPDEDIMRRFFRDPQYQAARSEHFDPSVGAATVISAYEAPDPS
ncbi:MAG: DUF1330 domain-containing protein [Gemmatimonadetes bacterium]|nr:DUF1330 domain-containing protein [Gemmatimonadota bacterium]